VKSVLDAAAMTYVAGLAAALAQLLYYVFLIAGTGRRRR
ncbi:MAG: zinc metallopeptidase, partial [Chloroflexi bacterium]|nr:zinc metallopeptidase [Chloroflexota bacterium]